MANILSKKRLCVIVGLLLPPLFSTAQSLGGFSVANGQGYLLFYDILDTTYNRVSVKGDPYSSSGGYVHYPGVLNIPDTVRNNGTLYHVTAISDYGFSQHMEITSIILPSTLVSIGDYAFYWCIGISELFIPSSVETIGLGACFPIPNIIYNGFATGSPWYARAINAYEEDSLFYKDSTKTYLAGARKEISSAVIPNTVDTIGALAFGLCLNLESVIFPNSIVSINRQAFRTCLALENIIIPYSVRKIDDEAFMYCGTNGGVLSIENAAVAIGIDAFAFSNIASIDFGNRIQSIDDKAFSYCTRLQSVSIPASIETIGDSVFYYCTNLQYADIFSPISTLPNYSFCACTSLEEVRLPSTITRIGDYAFADCSNLPTVTIPEFVTEMGDAALANCTNIQSIHCLTTTPPVAYSSTFYGCNSDATLLVPCNSSMDYLSDPNWNHFNNIEEDCEDIEESESDRVRVLSINNALSVYGAQGESLRVFDAVGRQLYYKVSVSDVEIINVPSAGVYIVKVGNNKAKKVITIK